MEMIQKVKVEISVVIGSTRMPIRQLLRMGRGAIIAFETRYDAPVEIYANNELIAHGQVQIDNDRISIRITERLKRRPSVLATPVAA